MSETKQDVFDEVLDIAAGCSDCPNPDVLICRYAAALPDEVPTLPDEIGEWVRKLRGSRYGLEKIINGEFAPNEITEAIAKWFFREGAYEDTVLELQKRLVRAWLDGVWIVEETREVVRI